MEYQCNTISVERLPVGHQGVLCPLCDMCSSMDCSNPIQKTKVSIRGITEEHRTYVRGTEPYYVVACQGFIK